MVNTPLAVALYIQGFTISDIGREFGVSRQRAWQIIKKNYQGIDISKRTTANGKSPNPRPEERYVFKQMVKRGLKPIFQNYNAPNDIVLGTKKIQIKYRSHVRPVKSKGRVNYYYYFDTTREKEQPDFYIFVCGFLDNPTCYIVPGDIINSGCFHIPEIPLQKNTKRFSKMYKNNWKLLF